MSLNISSITSQNLAEQSVKIILDTDMGSDCDDVGALALLNEYSNDGQAEIIGVIYSSGAIPYGVGVIDAINRYYGNNDIPIGANYDSTFGDPIDKMQAEKLAKDTSAFKNTFIKNTDVPEQTLLLRRLLANETDHSITYVTIGHTRALYDLLKSQPDKISDFTGLELVNKKIKKWIALGALGANSTSDRAKDWNFYYNGTADYTAYLVNHFPKPIYFVDGGTDIMTGKSLMNTPNGNIIRTAYRDWLWNVEKKTLADQRPSWDLVAVCFAVEKSDEYFDILTNGYLDFDQKKGCKWVTSDRVSNQNFVVLKKELDAHFSNYLNHMISKRNEMKN